MTEKMGFAQINDFKMHYKLMGSGEPMVLIMGFRGNMDWWPQPVLNYLSERYQLILLDNRGTGQSERGLKKYTMATLADDVHELLKFLGLEKAHIFGVSMGGMIAQEFAIRHPHQVKRMILANTLGKMSLRRALTVPHFKFGWRYLTNHRVRQSPLFLNLVFTQRFRHECSPEEWRVIMEAFSNQTISKRCVQEQILAIMSWHSLPRLRHVQMPVLVLSGSEDLLIAPQNSFAVANRLRNCRFVCLQDQGHGMLYEAFDKVIPYLEEFLAPDPAPHLPSQSLTQASVGHS